MPSPLRLASLAACLALLPAAGGCGTEPLDVAPNVNLAQFQGKWYEIARLPRTTQTDCYGTTAFYSQGAGGSLQLVHQCNVGSNEGPLETVSMAATVPDPSVSAKLAVNVGGYTGDYWILDVGPQYEYALVGHPSRLYLWILSRSPTLDTATTQSLLAKAQAEHFDTTQILYTPQTTQGDRVASPGPIGPIPPALGTGCAIRPRASGRSAGALGGTGLACAFALARLARGRRRGLRAAS